MTNEKLYEAIGEISDNKIKEAKQVRKNKQSVRLRWGLWRHVCASCWQVPLFFHNEISNLPVLRL